MGLTEYIFKARSGVYKDTPENRRLHRVGQRYGESTNQREQREAFERRRDDAHRETSERQVKKLKQLEEALAKEGIKGFSISRSVKSWGVSTYLEGNGVKVRISDHDVSNTGRVLNEIHMREDSDIDDVVRTVKREVEDYRARTEARARAWAKAKAEFDDLDSYWESIKDDFKNKVFKKNDRTYQTPEEFAEKGKYPKTNIHVKELGGGAYAYEWTEPTEYNQWGYPDNPGNRKPTNSWLKWYRDRHEVHKSLTSLYLMKSFAP